MPSRRTSSQQLNWGLLGTARINRALIPAIRAASRSRLHGVASRSGGRAAEYAAEWEIPVAYDSYDALIDDPAVHAVYVPLPNHLHVEWTLRAIDAGKHVLCEKPLALTPSDVDRVAAAARARGVVVAEAFMYRHHPLTRKVLGLVADHTLGTVRVVRGAFTFLLTRDNDVRLVPEWGGGSLWDVGCYPVSYARLVAGAEPVAVTGTAERNSTGVDVAFGGTLEFAGGMQAVVDAGFRAHFRTFVEIAGTEGVLTIETPFKPGEHAVLRLTRGAETELIDVVGEPLYLGEVEDIERAVFDGRPQTIPLEDTRGNVAALVALHRAAQEGRHVRLDEVV